MVGELEPLEYEVELVLMILLLSLLLFLSKLAFFPETEFASNIKLDSPLIF